ncbi:YciI family protein [Actinoplanes sp. CA-051413]|uniref:YciI family protein n=1 Tax=Actinoplanes sp. CA-051413 TaxID=3239899 RepID=UPI003D999CF0
MKTYLLSIYQPDGPPPSPEALEPVMAELAAIAQDMQDAGAFVFSAGLCPPGSATVIRARDGDVLLTDGPFLESKEFVGGFTVITAPDLDAALKWGERMAAATTLPVEVRPFQT